VRPRRVVAQGASLAGTSAIARHYRLCVPAAS
jgi:hypothetical protein